MKPYSQRVLSSRTSNWQAGLSNAPSIIGYIFLLFSSFQLEIGPRSFASEGERFLRVTVVDAESGQPIPARLYLHSRDGKPYFFSADDVAGSAVKYEKQNWINAQSVEYHTTISAHQVRASLAPGSYELVVERGKEYHPARHAIEIEGADVQLKISLKRWFNASQRGWFSGDTHIHRSIDELKNVIVAEDLNVAMPLTYWVTRSHTPPSSGDKNLAGDIPANLIAVDAEHLIWPRNTEYEIFSVGPKRHTLGALFVLGHDQPLSLGVPNWEPIIKSTRSKRVLYDMDKLDWPFSMLLPVLAPSSLYELANNHMWRTEFAFEKWNSAAPPWMQPPYGAATGGERQWIDYTHAMYHALLNCGLRLPPTAGTANGVHPVPAGFGRVYVQTKAGFSYENWLDGLQQGRSFVTTGPMLLAQADGHDPGHVFQFDGSQDANYDIPLKIEVTSQSPILYGELLINGEPARLLRFANSKTDAGAYTSLIKSVATVRRSGWFAIRVWEQRDDARVRFAHTAPWYVEVNRAPVQISGEQKEYLVGRMRQEIDRSSGVMDADAIAEYQRALQFYAELPEYDDTEEVRVNARPLVAQRQAWLDNMISEHRFTPQEIRLATGLTLDEARLEIQARGDVPREQAKSTSAESIRVLPYPGGRHPRRGFLDGAIAPQRETKISAFTPWKDGGYVVVDVPEAIFSNLGLTYLAHTHVRTIWDERQVSLGKLEWESSANELRFERELPNKIRFGSRIQPGAKEVLMEMWLTNGTSDTLKGLRSQVCTMLKGAIGFNSQFNANVFSTGPFIAVRHEKMPRWIIVGWTPHQRSWNNPPVPCIHSDPVFPDCEPGQTVRVRGGLWFFEGEQIEKFVQEDCRTGLEKMAIRELKSN